MIAAQQSRASSPSSLGWGKQSFSALSNRLTTFVSKTLTGTPHSGTCYEDVCLSSFGLNERSQSRGRDAFASSGRGGLGNIRQASLSRPDSSPAPELVRGREPNAGLPTASKVYATGRGGAGNIRSPSRSQKRDPSQPPTLPPVFDTSKEDIMRNHRYLTEEAPVRPISVSHHAPQPSSIHPQISTGRGGVGNINSRSQSRGPAVDLNKPNSGPPTPSKVSLPKDAHLNKGPLRSAEGRGDASTAAYGPSPATIVEDVAFTYPPAPHQTPGRARED